MLAGRASDGFFHVRRLRVQLTGDFLGGITFLSSPPPRVEPADEIGKQR